METKVPKYEYHKIREREVKTLTKIEEITVGQAHENTWKLYRNISTGTAVFINQKRSNVCEYTAGKKFETTCKNLCHQQYISKVHVIKS